MNATNELTPAEMIKVAVSLMAYLQKTDGEPDPTDEELKAEALKVARLGGADFEALGEQMRPLLTGEELTDGGRIVECGEFYYSDDKANILTKVKTSVGDTREVIALTEDVRAEMLLELSKFSAQGLALCIPGSFELSEKKAIMFSLNLMFEEGKKAAKREEN